ncbi:MAG: sodium:proton antiporter [Clostridia bacterium]|nr:sodium:proton antiporter [Clostridia bacterium]
MKEQQLILPVFCAVLLISVTAGFSILYALVFGLALFLLYGRRRGFSWNQLFSMTMKGVRTVGSIVLTFFLIGILTALWRAAGTIPVIICWASGLIHPSLFLLLVFLLCCGLSFLTGTSLGTAATMGVICASMGRTMGVPMWLTGGAILSGAFFGDRCSPVSTSALLTAKITDTDIYGNIRNMVRTALVPFLITCALYSAAGALAPGNGAGMDVRALFSRSFALSPLALLPAAAILVLACFRVRVRMMMLVSILLSIPICLLIQGMSVRDVLISAVRGFSPANPEVAAVIGGGGALSMLNVAGIVLLSSAYSGLMQETGLLDGIKTWVDRVSKRAGRYPAALLVAVASSMFSCNQTLAIMLTCQLFRDLYPSGEPLALDLEDSAAIVSPLIPWCIAGAVPLATVGANSLSLLAAFYLMLIPLWRLIRR